MSGSKQRKTRGNQQETAKNEDCSLSETTAANKQAQEEHMEAIQANIIAELRKIQDDAKKELIDKIEGLKSEISGFRNEMGKRMDGIAEELKGVTRRVDEAEQRIADIEECNADTKDILQHVLHLQLDLQTQVTDLEARSRRNNIRVHGLAEEAEGTNIKMFIENFLQSEFPLGNTPLQIQRCYRSLGPKPPPGANPRSVVMSFQEYTTKETVLRAAWEKKVIEVNGKRVYFDHDYPRDILLKRKAFNPIRKILKDKGYRFHTLYPAKLRVFYERGPATYNTPEDAMDDLKKRGMIQEDADPLATAAPTHKPRNAAWDTMRGARLNREEHLRFVKERLRGFRRPDSTD